MPSRGLDSQSEMKLEGTAQAREEEESHSSVPGSGKRAESLPGAILTEPYSLQPAHSPSAASALAEEDTHRLPA